MFIKNVYYFEVHYLRIIKKLIKSIKKKHNNLNKVWFSISLNFYISKKSVNSRMGKGKGKFSRSIIRLKKYSKILEFGGYKKLSVLKLNTLIYKKTSLKLLVKSKNHLNHNNLYSYYCRRYLVI